jgi:hypothetical protein
LLDSQVRSLAQAVAVGSAEAVAGVVRGRTVVAIVRSRSLVTVRGRFWIMGAQ